MADATKWGIYQDVLVQQNTDYTFSIDVNQTLWMECRALTTTTSSDGTITPTGIVNNSGWTEEINSNTYNYDNRRYSKTFNTGNYKAYRFFIYGYATVSGYNSNKAGRINHPQLEIGNKASDWTPSPLDNKEQIDEKASQEEITKIVSEGSKNLLYNTMLDDYDSFNAFEVDTMEVYAVKRWCKYAHNNVDLIDSGDEWSFENDFIPSMYGYRLDIYYYEEEGEEEGDIYYFDGGYFQDVAVKPNTDYVFSCYTMYTEYVSGSVSDYRPLIDCKAINPESFYIHQNSGWDSKDFEWDMELYHEDTYSNIVRVYKTFNSGNHTMFRFRYYGSAEWNGSGWDSDAGLSTMCRLQLEEGTTPTEYEKGFDSLEDVQHSIAILTNGQNEFNQLSGCLKDIDRYYADYMRGNGSNLLHNTELTTKSQFTIGDITQFNEGCWKIDNSGAETWVEKINSMGEEELPFYYDTRDFNNEYIDMYYYPSVDFFTSRNPNDYEFGEIIYCDGGLYQDVSVYKNANYTFSAILDGSCFVDCKALSTNADGTVSVVPNTGFVIRDGLGYSPTWDTMYNLVNTTDYISFNTGNYDKYRFRIHGACRVINRNNAKTFDKYTSWANYFCLKQGSGTAARKWDGGKDYLLSNIYNMAQPSTIINLVYPVGSYYETSDTDFNPNYEWGGVWILETAGMVHVSGAASGTYTVNGANSANGAGAKDGGAATVALTAAQTGIRNHTHTYSDYNTTYTLGTTKRKPGTSTAVAYGTSLTAGGGATTRTSNNPASEQSGAAHENMPPYIVVNRWHRIA